MDTNKKTLTIIHKQVANAEGDNGKRDGRDEICGSASGVRASVCMRACVGRGEWVCGCFRVSARQHAEDRPGEMLTHAKEWYAY